MHLLGSDELTFLLTLLAERMRLDVTVADSLPRTAISFIGFRVTLVMIVVFVNYFLMLGAVLLAYSKPTAAGVSTGTLWFVWHLVTSLSINYNDRQRSFPSAVVVILFFYPNINITGTMTTSDI